MRNSLTISLVLLFLTTGLAQAVAAQSKATKFRLKSRGDETYLGRELYITVAGKERKIFDDAFGAWLINDGQDVVFSGSDGAGGFENEGQSLRIYNVRTRGMRKILSEYVFVLAVQAVKTSTGATALLVKMGDGGLGGSYFAVVDPNRGEVLFRHLAELTAISGDTITVAFYHDDDFDKINEERGRAEPPADLAVSTTKVRPYKIEKHDLKTVLRNRVIYNKPTNLEADDSAPVDRDVKVFLWEVNSKEAALVLKPFSRRVGAASPLRYTLQMLFAGPSQEEMAQGFSSSTFGMKFEDVRLQNGVALIKFSQPPNHTNYGSMGPAVFAQAIEKTARQFPTVKKVQICAVGETLIDSQLEKPFPKCER
jgi:spore germination protein GerM